jgi:OOP family OmpA-OmpF porin
MALFDSLINDAASRFGLGASATPLVREVLSLATGSPGGLGGFLDTLKSSGLGSEAASWVGHADAPALLGPQLERAIGASVLGGIASRLGLGGPIVSTAIAYVLPKLIGLLTPGGAIPARLPAEVTNFLHPQLAQRVVEAVTPKVVTTAPRVADQVAPRRMTVVRDDLPVVHDEPHMTRWLWPLLGALAVLGLGSYLFSNSNRPVGTAPVAQAPVVVPPAPPAPTLPPRLAISNDDGVIHYSGAVHDEETRTSIIDGLKSVFGADKIQGDIAVDLNRGAAPWLVNFRNALENFKVPGVQAMFDGSALNLGGLISDADRERMANSLKGVLGSGIVFGTLADKAADLVTGANAKVASALSSMKPGFGANDLVAVLNQSIVNFPTGGSEVPAGAVGVLQNAAKSIKQLAPGTVIEIAGYTDNSGDPAVNVALSQQRADAVRNVLIQAGVDPAMVVAKGYGSANPIASNDMLEGRFRNRRIEYHVVHAS